MAKKPNFLDKDMLGAKPKAAAQSAPDVAPPPARQPKDYGEPLNFRVPKEFAMQFRMSALRHGLKLHELLRQSYEVWLRENGEDKAA